MSILRDIIDISTDFNNTDVMPKYNKKYSAAVEAKKGIMQFPLLVSRTVSLEETTMITKAVERQMVSFLRVITSINSVSDAKSIENYIKSYHQNFKFHNLGDAIGESVSAPLEKTNILMRYNSINPDYLSRARDVEKSVIGLSQYISAFKNPDCEVVDVRDLSPTELDFVTNSIEEEDPDMKKSICRGNLGITLIDEKNKKIKSVLVGKDFVSESIEILSTVECPLEENNKGVNIYKKSANQELNELHCESVKELREFKGLRESKLNDLFTSTSATKVFGKTSRMYNLNESDMARVSTGIGPAPTVERDDKKFTTVLDNQLSDNDSKKANELVPTMMHIKTYFKTNDNELQAVDYMIGVKAVVHPIESDSMVNNLEKGTKKGKKLFNFLKFTSGEISFFKDFVFAVGASKEEVLSKYHDSPWWSMLIRRRKRSKILQTLNTKSQLVPNTTIVISMEEANLLKDKYKVNVLDVKTIRDLCDEYFLLGFIVLDSSIEVAHLYFDGDRDFSELSYTALERENSNQARDVKNIMQMLGKM